ncbi:MAG: hypothetical protein DMF89_19575 [Acidobacteria bacterium]|nr:MAG: hypothetical protein DMF90_01860 [Acidobacteriota bacterium]PYR47191.1 MAG: hypothetical protein DMF89_19575 [Acidobacteriota bacterium]
MTIQPYQAVWGTFAGLLLAHSIISPRASGLQLALGTAILSVVIARAAWQERGKASDVSPNGDIRNPGRGQPRRRQET